jgi:hypothetical protein
VKKLSGNKKIRLEKSIKEAVVRRTAMFQQNDKAILTLSSSALGLSVAIFSKMENICPCYMLCVKISWIFFCIAILSIVFSYYLAQGCLTEIIKSSRRIINGESVKESFLSRYNLQLVEGCNHFSILFFAGGILVMVIASCLFL